MPPEGQGFNYFRTSDHEPSAIIARTASASAQSTSGTASRNCAVGPTRESPTVTRSFAAGRLSKCASIGGEIIAPPEPQTFTVGEYSLDGAAPFVFALGHWSASAIHTGEIIAPPDPQTFASGEYSRDGAAPFVFRVGQMSASAWTSAADAAPTRANFFPLL